MKPIFRCKLGTGFAWRGLGRFLAVLSVWGCGPSGWAEEGTGLRVGAAAVAMEARDDMVIAGGIEPGQARGQEGALRAVAVVIGQGEVELALVAVDVLMMSRRTLDPMVAEIVEKCGIPASHILINCTHTHHAPSTLQVHGYGADLGFLRQVHRAVVGAVEQAQVRAREPAAVSDFVFHLGREETVGENSRQMLPDGRIYWVGPRDAFVRPTGPFDPELAVLGFRGRGAEGVPGAWRAVLFNHSTHTIGTEMAGVRSPSFYGLAAQTLEEELGAVVGFFSGASGSTHNLRLAGAEMRRRMEEAVRGSLEVAIARPEVTLAAVKEPFAYRVRTFDEEAEDAAVVGYCEKWVGDYAAKIIPVFRQMRRELAPYQGDRRETWVQALRIGEVAVVGVPAEFFTKLGLDIKNRSPFRHTYVFQLANDWIGYLPDRDAHRLGGYQVWTGFHSYAEEGTGERMVEAALGLLNELKGEETGGNGSGAP